MAYSTRDDLEKAIYGETLESIGGENGVINEEWINEAIASADSEINFYCGQVYAVPFNPIPNIVKYWSVQLAIDWLYRRSPTSNESHERLCDRIREVLKKIAEGEMEIPDQSKKVGGLNYHTLYDENKFTMDCLED